MLKLFDLEIANSAQ